MGNPVPTGLKKSFKHSTVGPHKVYNEDKKMARQRNSNNIVINTSVPSHVYAEIDARASAAYMTRATTVRQALGQWHRDLKDAERLTR